MGKNKNKGGGGPSAPPEANASAVRDAAKKASSGKKGGGFPWHISLVVCVVAYLAYQALMGAPEPPKPAAAKEKRPAFVPKKDRGDPTADEFTPTGIEEQCKSWKRDGECENNPEFMATKCPKACPKKRKLAKKEPPPSAATPRDSNTNCPTWAAAGECDSNPGFMLNECKHACANGGAGAEPEAVDIHQDCAAWVSDGECYRNPAFMLQQCKASCSKFAADNDSILQDTSDTCVNFALKGGCDSDTKKASTICRASCHIQRICANHTETVTCSKALRCEAIGDLKSDCASRAAKGECEKNPITMLKQCLKSCSEQDVDGLMRFHMPHTRTTVSKLIDLPYTPPRLAGFYATPPQSRNGDMSALAVCDADSEHGMAMGRSGGYVPSRSSPFSGRVRHYASRKRLATRWSVQHWAVHTNTPGKEVTPRVPHGFAKVPEEEGSSRMVTVQHISFSPRIRYLHHLLSPEECEHILKVSQPLFSRSPVRGSVTRVRTSTTAMLGGRHDDAVVTRIRKRIARFSGYAVDLLEPLQVVRYERGQKYEGHHDFFDVCDLEDKVSNGRRQITFLIYLVGMPEGENGGGTRFPELNLEVMPEQGSAIVFNDCFDNGDEDGRSLHAGQPPLNPATVKYAINGWIRSRSVYSKMNSFI